MLDVGRNCYVRKNIGKNCYVGRNIGKNCYVAMLERTLERTAMLEGAPCFATFKASGRETLTTDNYLVIIC